MKCDTSERYSPKVGNELFNLFSTSLNTLCKFLPILFSESYDTFHSLLSILIESCMFSLASLALIYGCIWIPHQTYSRVFILIYPSSESSSVDDPSIESGIDSSSSSLHLFLLNLPL